MAVPLIVDPPKHPAAKLFARPLADKGQSYWLGLITMLLKLEGGVYLYKVRSNALGRAKGGKGLTKELIPITASSVTPVTTSSERGLRKSIKHYIVSGDTAKTIDADDIISIILPNPSSSLSGLSPAEVAQRDISLDNQATEWQSSSLQNRAIPDGIFTSKEYLSTDQRAEFEADLRNRWTNIQLNHLPFLLGSDAEFTPLERSAVELDLVNGRRFSREVIAAAFGVPDVLLAGSASTYANYETARLIMWEMTIWPIFNLICDALAVSLSPEYPQPFTVAPDYSSVDATIPIVSAKCTALKALTDAGITPKAAAAYLSMEIDTNGNPP